IGRGARGDGVRLVGRLRLRLLHEGHPQIGQDALEHRRFFGRQISAHFLLKHAEEVDEVFRLREVGLGGLLTFLFGDEPEREHGLAGERRDQRLNVRGGKLVLFAAGRHEGTAWIPAPSSGAATLGRLNWTAALMKSRKRGCAAVGFDLNSGWYCTPTYHGWS